MVLTRPKTSGMEQQPGETTEAYEARMLDMVVEYKQRAAVATSARKKEDEEAEEQRRLAEQQRQADADATATAADERRRLRRDKLLGCAGDIEVIAGEWAVAAEEEGAPSAVRGLATTIEHVSDLVATCAAQQEDILCMDTLVWKQIPVIDELLDRVRRLEQQLASSTPAGPSNLMDRVNVLEIDVETLKDGTITTNQRIDQQICAAAASSTATNRESIPKFDGLPIFCDATKTDPIPWWWQFELKLDIHHVINPNRHAYLDSRSGGACQAWLDNMLSPHNVAVSELHTKISWADPLAAWHKRFQVEPPELQAAEKLQRFYENDLPSTNWITQYQCLASTPNLPSTFVAIKHFFIRRNCSALQNALTQVEETLTTSEQLFDKASQIILTNIEAKNLGHSSAAGPGRGQHQPKVVVVAATTTTDPSNEAASSEEGDRLAATGDGGRPARGRGRGKPKTHTNSSPGAGPAAQEPWTHYGVERIGPAPHVAARDPLARFTKELDQPRHEHRTDVIGLCFLRAAATTESSPTDLSSDPRMARLLDEFIDIFESPIGVVPDRPISHEIILEAGVVPPKGCIYRMSEEELEVLRAQLDDLLDTGWIRPSSSPYGAPVLFVRKKNKDLRLCIDYRKLNAQTVKNAGPLPWIDDLLERLGGAKFFSKLDLKSGYHQISIRPQDCYKSALKTRYGHFEWTVMHFGLTNAPATFQAAMTNEFCAMLDRFVLVYLDDILIYSPTLEDHLEHLRRVLETLPTSHAIVSHARFVDAANPATIVCTGVTTITGPFEATGSDCHGHYRPVPQAQDRRGWNSHDGRRTHQVRHVFALQLSSKAPKLAEVLYAGWIRTKGYPKEIVCDRDTRFMSDFWLALIKRWGSSLKPSSARHPQTDGQTERAHQTAQVLLRILIRPDQKDWVERLPDVELAYNSSIHPAIGMSPLEFEHDSPCSQIRGCIELQARSFRVSEIIHAVPVSVENREKPNMSHHVSSSRGQRTSPAVDRIQYRRDGSVRFSEPRREDSVSSPSRSLYVSEILNSAVQALPRFPADRPDLRYRCSSAGSGEASSRGNGVELGRDSGGMSSIRSGFASSSKANGKRVQREGRGDVRERREGWTGLITDRGKKSLHRGALHRYETREIVNIFSESEACGVGGLGVLNRGSDSGHEKSVISLQVSWEIKGRDRDGRCAFLNGGDIWAVRGKAEAEGLARLVASVDVKLTVHSSVVLYLSRGLIERAEKLIGVVLEGVGMQRDVEETRTRTACSDMVESDKTAVLRAAVDSIIHGIDSRQSHVAYAPQNGWGDVGRVNVQVFVPQVRVVLLLNENIAEKSRGESSNREGGLSEKCVAVDFTDVTWLGCKGGFSDREALVPLVSVEVEWGSDKATGSKAFKLRRASVRLGALALYIVNARLLTAERVLLISAGGDYSGSEGVAVDVVATLNPVVTESGSGLEFVRGAWEVVAAIEKRGDVNAVGGEGMGDVSTAVAAREWDVEIEELKKAVLKTVAVAVDVKVSYLCLDINKELLAVVLKLTTEISEVLPSVSSTGNQNDESVETGVLGTALSVKCDEFDFVLQIGTEDEDVRPQTESPLTLPPGFGPGLCLMDWALGWLELWGNVRELTIFYAPKLGGIADSELLWLRHKQCAMNGSRMVDALDESRGIGLQKQRKRKKNVRLLWCRANSIGRGDAGEGAGNALAGSWSAGMSVVHLSWPSGGYVTAAILACCIRGATCIGFSGRFDWPAALMSFWQVNSDKRSEQQGSTRHDHHDDGGRLDFETVPLRPPFVVEGVDATDVCETSDSCNEAPYTTEECGNSPMLVIIDLQDCALAYEPGIESLRVPGMRVAVPGGRWNEGRAGLGEEDAASPPRRCRAGISVGMSGFSRVAGKDVRGHVAVADVEKLEDQLSVHEPLMVSALSALSVSTPSLVGSKCGRVYRGEDAHRSPGGPVAAVVAVAAVRVKAFPVGGSAGAHTEVSLRDVGVHILDTGMKRLSYMSDYSASSMRRDGFTQVAREVAICASIRTGCEEGPEWEVDCENKQLLVDSCSDTTAALGRLSGQLQQLYGSAVLAEVGQGAGGKDGQDNHEREAEDDEESCDWAWVDAITELVRTNDLLESEGSNWKRKEAEGDGAGDGEQRPGTTGNVNGTGTGDYYVEEWFKDPRSTSERTSVRGNVEYSLTGGRGHSDADLQSNQLPSETIIAGKRVQGRELQLGWERQSESGPSESHAAPCGSGNAGRGGARDSEAGWYEVMGMNVLENHIPSEEEDDEGSLDKSGGKRQFRRVGSGKRLGALSVASSIISTSSAASSTASSPVGGESLHRSSSSKLFRKEALPKRYPPSIGRVFVHDWMVRWRMYGGSDWPMVPSDEWASEIEGSERRESRRRNSSGDSERKTGRSAKREVVKRRGRSWGRSRGERKDLKSAGRRTEEIMEVHLGGMSIQYDLFPEDSQYISRLAVAVNNVGVYDLSADADWKLVLGYYTMHSQPRESTARAFKLELDAVKPTHTDSLEEYRHQLVLDDIVDVYVSVMVGGSIDLLEGN
ncbi:hypothetical protein CBR_g37898 [Chara braunii]|uniref:Integrase catalytic domain-containing protein n=1 Tax=Chara braunii TaxID=69332 RepID=A0A388LP90_CHABU|nr:hypothetical protein CBR_g37898 [Chara braunii]|eukprot:GBG84022.1 hypothetical protein CBR_g37898 [Chara braunii]